jgi:hypothetical protein
VQRFRGGARRRFWYHAEDFFDRTADLKNNKKGAATHAAIHAMMQKFLGRLSQAGSIH